MTGTAPGLSGNQKRKMKSAARLYAVQALFQMEHSSQTVERVRREFLDHRFGATYDGEEMLDGDITLFARLLEDAVNYQAPIDQMTDRALVAKWPIARIDPTLRALFRAAGAELRDTGTPPRVVISEYLDVARAFFPDGKEASFVNAVLDHMAREARPEAF
ncbi:MULTISPECIES: transcription antitermination factor NusB [unclassified Sulfitobacter]|jgi:N utilization substance protein B|uniref:transcription antitermination factor NusB n=1 Tax=unclassified Sulfitobacter TaxID=196795 RepID=UPI0007C36328|nr:MULTISPECIES: transcription antitermination factor NusB [unclassified Sulfitobacter]KZY05724.1 transcription antitermination factor NusB [Sulfitobacter sp. HI0023]KZY22286.1 transcription antitermination factor NusB [Sulfitobacter sp. HI0040]KZZ68405.1 transcription antitermination factor NusB [Sulfitobacter sp. HI0129]MAM25784.1 transcription antitermination factor NusB [Paracoccaceae bacterium]